MDDDRRLRRLLRQMYDAAAASPAGLLSEVNLPRGRELLLGLGYPDQELSRLPAALLDRAFPCGNPLPAIAARQPPPARILDLGCGCGLDACLLAARMRGKSRITAVDLSGRLLEIGRRAAADLGLQNLEFVQADMGSLPFARPLFSLATMNGSFNVIRDKHRLLHRLGELLLPGGHLLINDLLLIGELPPGFAAEPVNWTWNIAGALSREGYRQLCRQTPFTLVELHQGENLDPVAPGEMLLRKKG